MPGMTRRMPWRRVRSREVVEEGREPPPLPPRADPWPWLFLLVALVTAGVIALWWWQEEENSTPTRTTTTVVTEETVETAPAATTTATETVTETETVEGAPALVEVPDVTGPTEAEARRIAEEAGFDVRVEDTNAPTAEEVGEVVLQRPDAGTRAPEGSEITLFVGR